MYIDRDIARNLLSFYELFGKKIDKAFVVNFSKEKIVLSKKITSFPFAEFIKYNIF